MPYYKDTNNNLHYLDLDQYEHLLPSGCVRITNEEAVELQAPHQPRPKEQKIALITQAVQAHLDAPAQALNYDDLKTAVTYAEEPSVSKFQNEGKAFRAWRSLVWASCYQILAEVEAETRTEPTIAELLAELPVLTI